MDIYKKIIGIIVLLLLSNCRSNGYFSYWDINVQTEKDLLAEEAYNKITDNGLKSSNEFVLLKFNLFAFKDTEIILNKNDTINFRGFKTDCGEIMRRVPKSAKHIVLYTAGEPEIKVPIMKGYDFIMIQGINNHRWNIIYSQFYPKFECM